MIKTNALHKTKMIQKTLTLKVVRVINGTYLALFGIKDEVFKYEKQQRAITQKLSKQEL